MSTDTRTFSVPGISCDHCRRAIEERVGPVTGVHTVTVDVDARTVTVTGGETGDIEAAITDAGYAVV